jgi:chemotaxis methyl-accepting protein methylase
LQNRLIPLFHYSLKPEGLLFLGTSETIGKYAVSIPLRLSASNRHATAYH